VAIPPGLLAVLIELTAGQTAAATKQPSIGSNAHAGATIAADRARVAASKQVRLMTKAPSQVGSAKS
jgi:hypothetical protein